MMKKNKYKQYYNYNVKKLNIIVKYKKCKKNNDCYITTNGLKTNQKIYKYANFSRLITYIKKDGNFFESKKKVNKEKGIKHLIISPINPIIYNKLNEKEKKELQKIIIKNIFKNLGRFGFIVSIENKKRNINDQEYDHFHVHIGISASYDISLKNIDFLKRSIANDLLKSDLKNKLGLKTKNELISETKNLKNKKLYEEKKLVYNNISFLFNELLNINNNIKNEKENINIIKFNIENLNDDKKRELRYISKEKEFLLWDIKDTKQILKYKNKEINDINKNITNTINNFKNEKNTLINIYTEELKNLKNYLYDDLFYFKEYIKWENNIYIKFLKHRLKNKEIDLPTFLYLISVNKYYQKNRIKYKQEEIKNKIKSKNEELKNKINSLNEKLKNELNYLKNKKSYVKFSKTWDENKLKDLLNKLNSLNTKKKFTIENFHKKINLLYTYLRIKQKDYKKLLLRKKLTRNKINQEKEKIEKINKELEIENKLNTEIKKYPEIKNLINEKKINKDELIKNYKEFMKDKNMFPELKFINYIKAYIKNRDWKFQQKIKIKNINPWIDLS